MSLSTQWDIDALMIFNKLKKHEKINEIKAAYLRGPPEHKGFMFWDDPIVKIAGNAILQKGYDSSAYACMHRSIQNLFVREKDSPTLGAAADQNT